MAPSITLSCLTPRAAWLVGLGGLGACMVAAMLRVAGFSFETWPAPTLVLCGLVAAGLGAGLYAQGGRASDVSFRSPLDLIAIGVTTFSLAVLALGVTYLCCQTFLDQPANSPYPGTTAGILVWLSIVPAAAGALWELILRFRKLQDGTESASVVYRFRLAALMTMLALAFGAAIFVFTDPEQPLAWDTMRLFFRNMAVVSLMGASLAILSERPRRWAASVLIVLHMSAIVTATQAVPPSPSPINQIWIRVFRPYLEFMYLNNAYHFYSPEPGPPTHLWMRIVYDTGKKVENEAGKEQIELKATWLKLPDMDYPGNHRYPVSLVYQRILAITENAASNDNTTNLTSFGPEGLVVAPAMQIRLAHSPGTQGVLGQIRPQLVVPFHTDIPEAQQYTYPTLASKKLLESYARHVASLPPPEEGWTFRSVKIYRVLHVLPTIKAIVDGREPQDPLWFRPTYAGEYDAAGNMLDPNDPFLWWVLPVLRDDRTRMTSTVRNWALKHAGDPNWIWDSSKKEWTDKEPKAGVGP